MKNGLFKKITATVIAAAMTLSMAPVVFAANVAGDITSLKFNGVTIPKNKIQIVTTAAADEDATLNGIVTGMVDVFITEADSDKGKTELLSITETATSDVIVRRVPQASVDTDVVASKKISEGKGLGAAWGDVSGTDKLSNGDVILIIDGSTDDAAENTIQYLALRVNIPNIDNVKIAGSTFRSPSVFGAHAATGSTIGDITTRGLVNLSSAQAANGEGIVVTPIDPDKVVKVYRAKTDDITAINVADVSTNTTDFELYEDEELVDGDQLVIAIGTGDFSVEEVYVIEVNIIGNAGSDDNGIAIEGDSEIYTPILVVTVPTDLSFRFDAQQLTLNTGEYGVLKNQIAKENYYIRNYTEEAAVKVSFDLVANLSRNVELQAATANDSLSVLANDPSKKLTFGIMGATEVKGPNPANVKYNEGNADTINFFTPANPANGIDENTGFIDFVLGSSADTEYSQEAAFTFFGQLNPNAAWVAGDLKVSGVYTITALNPNAPETTYNKQGDVKFVAGVPGMLNLAADERTSAVIVPEYVEVTLPAGHASSSLSSLQINVDEGVLTYVYIQLPDGVTSAAGPLVLTTTGSYNSAQGIREYITGEIDSNKVLTIKGVENLTAGTYEVWFNIAGSLGTRIGFTITVNP